MAAYWLTPITCRSPLTLGAERIRCSGPDGDLLRERLQSVHPRLLMMFKSRLLAGEDADFCGGEEPALGNGQPIVFSRRGGIALSHCAESFVDRLPAYDEVHRWLLQAKPWWSSEGANGEKLGELLQLMCRWNRLGCDVILIREE